MPPPAAKTKPAKLPFVLDPAVVDLAQLSDLVIKQPRLMSNSDSKVCNAIVTMKNRPVLLSLRNALVARVTQSRSHTATIFVKGPSWPPWTTTCCGPARTTSRPGSTRA
jgi:hypothetical protein